MRYSSLLPILLPIALISVAVPEMWPDRDRCRAAFYAYFYLGKVPAAIGERDGWYTLSGSRGEDYRCRVKGTVLDLEWKGPDGQDLSDFATVTVVRQYLAVQIRNDVQIFRYVHQSIVRVD